MLTIRVRSAVWFVTGSALALVAALLVMQAWSASAAPGDSDSTFVPITTCRLMDTRPPTDRVGLLDDWGPTETKTVQSTGTNGNCTVPTDAVGLSLERDGGQRHEQNVSDVLARWCAAVGIESEPEAGSAAHPQCGHRDAVVDRVVPAVQPRRNR